MKIKEPIEQLTKQQWLTKIANRPIVVNRKWGPQLKEHPVLRKLLRTGVLKRTRHGSRNSKTTIVMLANRE